MGRKPQFLLTLSFHHNREAPNFRRVVEAKDERAALVFFLCDCIESELGTDAVPTEPVAAALDKLTVPVESAADKIVPNSETVVALPPDEDGESISIVLWRLHADGEESHYGFGCSDTGTTLGTDKYENCWIRAQHFEPDEKYREELDKYSRDELIDLLLVANATGFRPSIAQV